MKEVLIGMAVYSLADNNKDEYLERTLQSLFNTVDYNKHTIMLSVNAFTNRTLDIIRYYQDNDLIKNVIFNESNIGTAEAVNKIWRLRQPGQHCIKMDDDVTTEYVGWVEEMVMCIERDTRIGIIGLKRKDLIQTPKHENPSFRSVLKQLPHNPGERWLYIEETEDIMGTCTIYNSELLDKIGFLRQIKKYGYDDCLACIRSRCAGFYNCFISHIEIEHIDPGGGTYQQWKSDHAAECTNDFVTYAHDIAAGRKTYYYNPFINVR